MNLVQQPGSRLPCGMGFPVMNTARVSRLLAGIMGVFLCSCSAFGSEGPLTAAVASKVSPDYVRTKLPDGSFQAETYAFGEGGYWAGGMRDKTVDETTFKEVARVMAATLNLQNYRSTTDAKTTRLLIMVYWGTTNPPLPANASSTFQSAANAMGALQVAKLESGNAPPTASMAIQKALGTRQGPPEAENAATAAIALLQAENALRRRIDAQNSRMLGYDSLWSETARFEGTPLDTRRNDMIGELEDPRYFVVLMAYDFQLMWKNKQHKLLWETRFSIREQGHEFDRELPAMAKSASFYFGRDSRGLQRRPLQENINLGELKILGFEQEKK